MSNPLKKKSGFILVIALGLVALITIVMVELASTPNLKHLAWRR